MTADPLQPSSIESPGWKDQSILVTGATGFIGGRVCERLLLAGANRIRALVHSPHRAARIGRLPVELCAGNLLDPASLRNALSGINMVIHCGLGDARAIVRGTENLLKASLAIGITKFIHMSTAAVYGLTPPPGSETEDAPVRMTGDQYCDNKGRAERVVLRFVERGLSAVILRPSIVWGPFSMWSTRLIEDLRQGRVILIDGGRGACNTTHVDNLVDTIFLSLNATRAVGQIFFVTDGERITWGDFIRAHRAMLGPGIELPEISSESVLANYKQRPGIIVGSAKATARVVRSREFRKMLLEIPITERMLAKTWGWLASLPDDQRQKVRSRIGVPRRSLAHSAQKTAMPDEVTFATQIGTVFFRIDKAKEILNYSPRMTFQKGIPLVEEWLRFANYLPDCIQGSEIS